MARLNDLKIFMEFEPIVKMGCRNMGCINHILDRGYMCCNLKYVDLDENGKCMMFQLKEIKAKNSE